MKLCGESRNAPGKNGRARYETAREKTCMDKKTGKHSLHCGSAWLRAGTKKRSLRCGVVLHTSCVPERQPRTASAHFVCAHRIVTRHVCRSVSPALYRHTSCVFSQSGKASRMFYAFRPRILLRTPQKAVAQDLLMPGRRRSAVCVSGHALRPAARLRRTGRQKSFLY